MKALGTVDGEYIFVTAFGERRRFTAAALHGRGGLADLFGGSLWWPLRHFRKFDQEKQVPVGELLCEECIAALMRRCVTAGFYDGSKPHRSVGVWRGPDGSPIVHAGDRIFYRGEIVGPGAQIGEALFVIGGSRESPSHTLREGSRSLMSWAPADAALGRLVTAHLGEWNWASPEALDLFQGGLHCDMLCSALLWLPHKFVLAPYGSGKSSLLRYAGALLGGGAHPVLRTYTKAYLEQKFGSTAAAFLMDEAESDLEADRIRRVFDLARLLSDDGAEGGRGSATGKSRTLDLHGTVTMAATVTADWPPQDRSRFTLLELLPLSDRSEGRQRASPEALITMAKAAQEMSPKIRARSVATWELFQENLKIARATILELGGQPRDADQLGHLIAGWKTMTSDDLLGEIDQLQRFRPFIMSLPLNRDMNVSVHLLHACRLAAKCDLSSTAMFAEEDGVDVEMVGREPAGARGVLAVAP